MTDMHLVIINKKYSRTNLKCSLKIILEYPGTTRST